jgi:hypothetical protein
MGGAVRVEVLYAAHLEGQGLSRWFTSQLVVSAVAIDMRLSVKAKLTDSSFSGRGNSWTYTFTPKNEQEAVDRVKAIAAQPADFFESGVISGSADARQALRALLPALKLKFIVDTTGGAASLSGDAITIAMGRYLAGQLESGAELTAELAAGITRYFAKAPFNFGYWAPYKRLIKLLESKSDGHALLAVALARVDGQLLKVAKVHANEQLRQFAPSNTSAVAGPDTVAYLMRRGRRWIRHLGREDQDAYVRCAAALLDAADEQGAYANISSRWILADILYGRGVSDVSHGQGALSLPSGQSRYDKRWDRFPSAWNQHLDLVRSIWLATKHNPEIQAWAFNVLKSQKQDLPSMRVHGLRLALLSPSKRLQSHAFELVAEKPESLLELDAATAQVFLEFCSPKQFSAAYPTLEEHSQVKPIQEAVLAYIGEHGLSEVRRGSMPSADKKRPAVLLRYSLRFLRERFNDADTYQLARYVGQSTQFKPVAQWKETFGALPLKTLIELRLHLPDLPQSVVRSIDAACQGAVIQGAGDEYLAAALTLSPSRELRLLGWGLLRNASDAILATVWNNLTAQASSSNGMELLLESLRLEERVRRIVQHTVGSQLLSELVTVTAPAQPRVAEGLLLRLAALGNSQQTLDTFGRFVERVPESVWGRRPAVLQKLIELDPPITGLVWAAVAGEPSMVAQIHVATRSLAAALVDTVDSAEVKTISSAKANFLVQALRSAPARIYRARGFAVACAVSPHPDVQQFVIARLESRRQVEAIFVPLAESGMPAAVAAAQRYIAAIKDRALLTKAVIAVCDSGVGVARTIGLRVIERQPERLDLNALLDALSEHTSPDITATVARFAASGITFKREALDQFDNRVLRTRRTGRNAKELVKSRLAMATLGDAVPIDTRQKIDDRRLQALIDMARGSSLRDRDWALQQLARLALEGHSVPQLLVSTTN